MIPFTVVAAVALITRGVSGRVNDENRLNWCPQDRIISFRHVLGFAVWASNPFLDQLRALDSRLRDAWKKGRGLPRPDQCVHTWTPPPPGGSLEIVAE
jgi:hypothetical protein